MELISHDDRTLEEHLSGLKKVAQNVLADKEQAFYNYDELVEQVFVLIAYHDLAKASIYFQIYLAYSIVCENKGHRDHPKIILENFIEENKGFFDKWMENPRLKNHSLFGAWMSLFFWSDKIDYSFDAFLFLTILKGHHGHLKNFCLATMNPVDDVDDLIDIFEVIDFENYSTMMDRIGLPFHSGGIKKLLESFRARKFDMLTTKLAENKDSSLYFKTLFLYSFLLSADKGDMMLKDKNLRRIAVESKIIDDFKKARIQSDFEINKLREEAYQIAVSNVKKIGNENFYSITLPTGLGKTFTAYKVALQIKELYSTHFKIIYCLPFTSIIDQNASIFKNILVNADVDSENIGIHHHLSVPDLEKDADDRIFPNWEYMVEGWQNEITITTFVQLWESIFACHNKQLRKFHNLANSIIILDEVQSINPKLYPAFEFVLESLAKYFNTKFIFVTATQPILLPERVKELCAKKDPQYFFKKMNRTTIDTALLDIAEPMTEEELAEIVLTDYRESKKSILIICNTIRYSQNVKKILTEDIEDENVFYLSASLIPYCRKRILEDEIKVKLKNKIPIILVSTQVVEAGVDIDFDTVYRDFAPLSSINQAAGRCNRNARKDSSKVIIFRSGKEKIYDPTQLDITKRVLSTFSHEIPESKFYELNRKYFEAVKDKIQEGSGISDDLIRDILSLNFEKVGTESKYRLFVENYKSYNYFIPVNLESKNIWEEYLEKIEIEDNFKRKQAIKLLMPKLKKYVVSIPDYILPPSEEEKEKTIIFGDNWKHFYDKKYGYKIPEKESPVAIF